jgi:hypothetical protein
LSRVDVGLRWIVAAASVAFGGCSGYWILEGPTPRSDWAAMLVGVVRDQCYGRPVPRVKVDLVTASGEVLDSDVTGGDGAFTIRPTNPRAQDQRLFLRVLGSEIPVPDAVYRQKGGYTATVRGPCPEELSNKAEIRPRGRDGRIPTRLVPGNKVGLDAPLKEHDE